LPVSQLTENIVYQTHITLFSVLSTQESHSSKTTLPLKTENVDITGFEKKLILQLCWRYPKILSPEPANGKIGREFKMQ
jgi:hypothetical protein